MGRRDKISVKKMAQSFPLLSRLTNVKSEKGMKRWMRKASCKDKDLMCRCVEIALRNLSEKNFSESQLQKMYAVEEKLNFLSAYAKCSGARKKCKYHERDNNSIQGGQGIGILFSVLLPIIANLILKHV